MAAIVGWIETNTDNALARGDVVHEIQKMFRRIIGKLPAERDRGAAADNEKLASMIAHVPRTGRVNFRVHAADAVKAVCYPQMAHGLFRERAHCGGLQDDASHRVGVMVLRVLGGLACEQDCGCGWINWCLSARCRCAEKNN